MSHGPPPTNLFGFGAMGMGTMNPMAAEAQDMVFLDTSMMNFDNMHMTLDPPDDLAMSQTFQPMTGDPGATNGLVRTNDQPFQGANVDDNVPGAGPLPTTSFGPQTNLPGGSTLTEFTKRRNWPAKVVEEIKDLLMILDSNGKVTHVSPSITALTGYSQDEVLGYFLKDLIHQDDVGVFVAELNESIASGNPLRMFYRLRKKDTTYAIFESVGHAHIAAAKFAPNPNNQSPFCQAVFMMSRPYPTKNANLLDSFLEHKIENERLRRRIADLRKEEAAEDADEAARTWRLSQEGRSDITPSEDTMATSSNATILHPASEPMAAPERPTPLNIALTRENLEGVAGSRPDSIKEKMARYEGATHMDTIEMLTGLRYQEGERSRGISTGNGSPTLVKGDVGIAIPIDRDPRTGEKKKKLKVVEEYVCTDCGTLESPEWRKGPTGPKTLCNACGLRWAKKEKKRSSTGGAVGHGMDHSAMA